MTRIRGKPLKVGIDWQLYFAGASQWAQVGPCWIARANRMEGKNKKVIVVTYYWPPAGGIGVLRCLKLAKYLARQGWEPVIFTSSEAAYQFLDPKNNEEVPEGTEVIRIGAFSPIEAFKAFSGRKKEEPLIDIMATPAQKNRWLDDIGLWIRGNFFIPDARAFWIRPAVRRIREWLRHNHADAIFSDGPPHTNTVVAQRIAEEFNLPWVADFQDPWTQVDYYEHLKMGRRADRIHRRMEQEVFRRADAITIASPTWASDLEDIGARHVEVLYYGYDEADFEGFETQTRNHLTIFHGGLLGNDRYPAPMVEALRTLKEGGEVGMQGLEIRLAGGVSSDVVSRIKDAGLEKELKLLGMVSRADVIDEISKAGILLLPINIAPNCKGRVPGKLFELMRSGKPILALGPVDGDVAQLLRQTGTGETFDYEDAAGVQSFLMRYFSGTLDLPRDGALAVDALSNEKGAAKLAGLLEEAIKVRPQTPRQSG